MSILFSKFNVTRQGEKTHNGKATKKAALPNLNLPPHTLPLIDDLTNLPPRLVRVIDVLICPRRVVPRLQDLEPEEITDLFLAVQRVGRVLERVYEAEGMTDGKSAGQSVPHVHVHLIPRKATDFGGDNDMIYPALETHEQGLHGLLDESTRGGGALAEGKARRTGLVVPQDEDRVPRSDEEMHAEAQWLASFFTPSSDDGVERA
ncbi:hypothetical protein QFC21_006560 [Naganishia friedmannii]|uniref:Uncharacterized protein n=1 Tax=Naganishia friedmannii TaxID=89922 RepID=A0ACC2V1F5_9TREE|nr:hypothetical protein QFC21_006560 [Naganishia friedmannii]